MRRYLDKGGMVEYAQGKWVLVSEAEAAIKAARAEVPDEIAAVVRAVPAIAQLWCDPGASKRLLDALDALTPAQRKACGLEEK
jgi:hypothetical protein